MSATDQLLANNRRYAEAFPGPVPGRPSLGVAVVACMDARMDVYALLGLTPGQAHVLRNAGGEVTDDMLRSLTISQHELGTTEILLIHHAQCGMQTFSTKEFKAERSRNRSQTALGIARLHRRRRRPQEVNSQSEGVPVPQSHPPGPRLRLRRRHRPPARSPLTYCRPLVPNWPALPAARHPGRPGLPARQHGIQPLLRRP
jgi:hypothetical protein